VIVSEIKVTSSKDWCELQAQVKSNTARKPILLRYCFPPTIQEFLSTENGDPFLVAVLLPAMKVNEAVEIPAYISPRLLRATDQIQALYKSWDKTLSKVQINAQVRDEHSMMMRRPSRRGLFFSCGVDSNYSLFKNYADHPNDEESITDLIVVRGFDIPFARDAPVFQTILSNARRVSRELGKNVVPLATNVRDFGTRFVHWAESYFGAGLASVALTLEGIFEEIYIASSFSYDQLFPWGSHPALDPLWSTECLSIKHDGCNTRRVDKTRFIAQFPIVTDTLRVCTYRPFSGSIYNCGLCEKCLRTMVALHIAGALQKSKTLPSSIDLRALRTVLVEREVRSLAEELMTGLGSSETDLAIKSALQEALSRSGRPRPRRAPFSPLLPLAAHVPPVLQVWVRLWRALRRSPPSSIFDLLLP
jgi:hypothetical protein